MPVTVRSVSGPSGISVRHSVGAVSGHATPAARRVEVRADEQRVADDLDVVHGPHLGSDRHEHVVGEAQQDHDVGVHEVPRGEHRESAAFTDLDGAPVLLREAVAEDPSCRSDRPEPVVVDGVPERLLAGGHLARLGIRRSRRSPTRLVARRRNWWFLPRGRSGSTVRSRRRGRGSPRRGCPRQLFRRRPALRPATAQQRRATPRRATRSGPGPSRGARRWRRIMSLSFSSPGPPARRTRVRATRCGSAATAARSGRSGRPTSEADGVRPPRRGSIG